MNPKIQWEPITRPYMHGYQTEWQGLTVELVRCYVGEWAVFLTRGDSVVACLIGEVKHTHQFNGRRQLSTRSPFRTLGEARRFALEHITQ